MNPLVIIAGPTAVGKSDMAVMLAKRINGEIISADSMQVYRGMDIGSAKITLEEMQGIKHHLIDILDPEEEFNVALFQKLANEACRDIYSRGHIPIVAGGTGFYIQALLYGINFEESEGEISAYRRELEALGASDPDKLYEMLRKVDPASCEIIHKNNIKRVVRALEFFKETGRPISEHNSEQRSKESIFNSCYFVLNADRDKVYEKIDRRVDIMIEKGLEAEVQCLKDRGLTVNHVSMNGLGYKEFLLYFNGEISYEEAIYRIKRDSRHFAKRQITWFKREKEVIWLKREDFNNSNEEILNEMLRQLKNKGII